MKSELLPEDSRALVNEIIRKFVDNLSKLAPELIKEYISLNKKLNKRTKGNKRTITAILNAVRGYDKHYWPNIDNEMKRDAKMKNNFDAIMHSINKKQIRLDSYKRLLIECQKVKSYITQIDDIIIKL